MAIEDQAEEPTPVGRDSPPPAVAAAAPDPPAESVAAPHPARAFLLYSLARLLLLVAVGGVLYLLGARGWLLVLVALVISGLISFIVLGRFREAMSAGVAARLDSSKAKREAAQRAEEDLY